MEILHKTTTLDERIYYIHQVNLHHWNKYVLRKYLSDDLYHHQGNMPNNFPKAIPDIKQSMKTISMFKDEYLLDFINTENLGLEIEDIDERVVEQEIVRNIRDFILQFGKDFIFMGNQYRVVLEGEEMFIDLLFFSRELAAMVAVELKYGKFKPSYLGQLCTYLQALDLTVKKPHENPSIGIVLCKEMNKAFVDIVVRNYDSPMGVTTYKTKQDMDIVNGDVSGMIISIPWRPCKHRLYPVGNNQMFYIGLFTDMVLEAEFPKNSYGFRPGRSCEQAVLKLLEYRPCKGCNATQMAFIADSIAAICNISYQWRTFGNYWHLPNLRQLLGAKDRRSSKMEKEDIIIDLLKRAAGADAEKLRHGRLSLLAEKRTRVVPFRTMASGSRWARPTLHPCACRRTDRLR